MRGQRGTTLGDGSGQLIERQHDTRRLEFGEGTRMVEVDAAGPHLDHAAGRAGFHFRRRCRRRTRWRECGTCRPGRTRWSPGCRRCRGRTWRRCWTRRARPPACGRRPRRTSRRVRRWQWCRGRCGTAAGRSKRCLYIRTTSAAARLTNRSTSPSSRISRSDSVKKCPEPVSAQAQRGGAAPSGRHRAGVRGGEMAVSPGPASTTSPAKAGAEARQRRHPPGQAPRARARRDA